MSDDESTRIIDLAEMFGLENSYMHSDEFQEQHRKDVKGNQSIFICSYAILALLISILKQITLLRLYDIVPVFLFYFLFFCEIIPLKTTLLMGLEEPVNRRKQR